MDILNKQGIEYMVVGSFSSNRYGVPRATNDADLVLNVVAMEREKLFRELPAVFEIDSQVTFEMIAGTWRQIIEIPSIPFTIELFELSNDPHDQCRFSRRKTLSLLSRQASVPTAEDVIVQKLRWAQAAKRNKDFEDVVAVMAVQGETKLDWLYIEKWCAEHGTLGILADAKAEASSVWEESF